MCCLSANVCFLSQMKSISLASCHQLHSKFLDESLGEQVRVYGVVLG